MRHDHVCVCVCVCACVRVCVEGVSSVCYLCGGGLSVCDFGRRAGRGRACPCGRAGLCSVHCGGCVLKKVERRVHLRSARARATLTRAQEPPPHTHTTPTKKLAALNTNDGGVDGGNGTGGKNDGDDDQLSVTLVCPLHIDFKFNIIYNTFPAPPPRGHRTDPTVAYAALPAGPPAPNGPPAPSPQTQAMVQTTLAPPVYCRHRRSILNSYASIRGHCRIDSSRRRHLSAASPRPPPLAGYAPRRRFICAPWEENGEAARAICLPPRARRAHLGGLPI